MTGLSLIQNHPNTFRQSRGLLSETEPDIEDIIKSAVRRKSARIRNTEGLVSRPDSLTYEKNTNHLKEPEHAKVYKDVKTIIMIKNNMLSKDGLTITSANHLANIAKEMYESLQSKLEALKLYSRDYLLAINGNTFRVENESEKSDLAAMSAGLKEIGELKSLIAYLREGIKAKMALDSDSSFEEYLENLIKEGREDLVKPTAKKSVTFEDEFAKLTTEQKARYYTLEAKCATIGNFIHPEGSFAKARKDFFEHKKNPTKVSGKGQEAEINSYTSSFTPEEVDSEFFSLQKEYRTTSRVEQI